MSGGDLPAFDRLCPASIPLRNGRFLDFTRAPLIMGVLNATPDSFYAGSRVLDPETATGRAMQMVGEGADIIDIGGESTRPGSEYVETETEIARVVPLIESIRRLTDVPISVDTRKAEVARRALASGADMINDISGLRDDPEMAAVATGAPVVLMHMKGTPATMQRDPYYDDALKEVCEELALRAEAAMRSGIPRETIIVDPGIGFGKRTEDNLALIKGIPKLKAMRYPVLIGLSRKGFLGRLTDGRPPEERLPATIAANAYAMVAGADILRVHDVREAVDMRRILRAIMAAG